MTSPLSSKPMTPDELEAALRRIGAERYHNLHPFHRKLTAATAPSIRCAPGR